MEQIPNLTLEQIQKLEKEKQLRELKQKLLVKDSSEQIQEQIQKLEEELKNV